MLFKNCATGQGINSAFITIRALYFGARGERVHQQITNPDQLDRLLAGRGSRQWRFSGAAINLVPQLLASKVSIDSNERWRVFCAPPII